MMVSNQVLWCIIARQQQWLKLQITSLFHLMMDLSDLGVAFDITDRHMLTQNSPIE